jgi:tetratricopeptide (TPR) repeat protein
VTRAERSRGSGAGARGGGEREPAAPSISRVVLLVLLAGALLAAGYVVRLLRRTDVGAELAAFPPPPDTPAAQVDFADFVGSDSCAECHAAEHAVWSRSTHARAGQAPPGDLVLRRFDGSPIQFSDATVEPRLRDGQYEFVVNWAGRTDRYPIVGVVGGAHMVGGGTQGFVWRHPDGSVRMLPFELEGTDRAWFCATSTPARRGWVRITPEMSIADCNDWPPLRVLGSQPRFVSCQECHGSQIELGRGPRPHETRFVSLSINCESCHGAGRQHIASARAAVDGGAAVPQPLATLSREESVVVCMRCHALKVDVRRGYLPGDNLEDRYSLKFPLLGGAEVHPDGRTRTFAYQQGHYYSDCYLSGSMTCVDCHEPHGQQYRDIAGRALSGRYDDAQCTACHPSKAQQVEQHTRHSAQSPGSRCVACHMPFVQESAVGREVRYTRADHTVSIPRPQLDVRLGVVNACRTCHTDRSGDQLTEDTRRLWGELKPLRPIIATLLDGDDVDDLQRALLAADTTHRYAYFATLARYFALMDTVDAGELPRRLRARLWQLAQSSDDDIAALALATLHVDGGGDADTRATLAERLRALGARDLRVRRRWAIALGHRADSFRERGRGAAAMALYGKALELLPDDPAFLLAVAQARLAAGDAARAMELLQRLTEIDSASSLAWINYGHARAAAGDSAGASAAYVRATTVNPHDGLAHFQLGNMYVAAGRRAEAAASYRRATELDAALAPAHFNLARLLLLDGNKQQALTALRAGLIFDPNHRDARAVVEQLEATLASPRGER